ncbi:hypothetical protein P280DRAFT_500356 [Massarina eburnea CBS 473.64]|uniref:Mitochondrial import inner membrane translocase subunit TIM54 n=1 Tax=Massarina eburnea CBS 473.64 TaxID=1395130 RepID=A0A6A6RRZ9_9PLEO|nr:hypothetical protein P280DRAFT_500356 [Massarina eburnea CBS 473.64]
MSGPDAKASQADGASASAGPAKPQKPPNPAFRMMGLPNFRLKLPSRNWMIFLGVTGTWTAAVMYDRREKKRIQKKWTKLVEHIARETLDEHQMPRKLTIYISAPPADGLVAARDHFNEYVKPILVAAALDWDAIEGRREGDVRAGLAERIRTLRKRRGEFTKEPVELSVKQIVEEMRQRVGIRDWDGPGGDVVIGRHTWKEYVRGLHEGWLGPLDNPNPVVEETPAPPPATPTPAEVPSDATVPTTVHDSSPEAEEAEKPKEEEKKAKKNTQPLPFNTTLQYRDSNLPPTCPQALGPATAIPLPHLLGFFNFPIRIYRFLNRRQVADDIGRQTAAAVLGAYRPFHTEAETALSESSAESSKWEQQRLLANEEPDWHKNAKKREEGDEKERVWLDEMVVDPRIGERMRKFELTADAEERAKRPVQDKGESWFQGLWPKKEKKGWEGLADDA